MKYKLINKFSVIIVELKNDCECGEIGRHKRLKISRQKWHPGSSPGIRTKKELKDLKCKLNFQILNGLNNKVEKIKK